MSFIINQNINKSVNKSVVESYDTNSVDVTSFTFSARSKTIAFELRYNNPNDTSGESDFFESHQVPIDEFDGLVGLNIQAFVEVRRAVFGWLTSKNLLPSGTDNFPG